MSPRRFSSQPVTLSFPPFTPAISWLVGINVAVYLLLAALRLAAPVLRTQIIAICALTPAAVAHGWIWQLLTYDFIHGDLLGLIFPMLMLWMFGAQLEQSWGARRLLTLYFISVIGAGALTTGLAYTGALGLGPGILLSGAAAGLYGIYIAFGTVFGENELFMFPLPFAIKAKYFVWILIVITLALSLGQGSAAIVQLAALLFGFVYVKYGTRMPARAYAGAYRGRGLSDRVAVPTEPPKQPLLARWRDSYYRWKRRRAARKFEVYMRKYDRKVYFDEHGNYIDPDSPQAREREDGDSKTPWVN